MLPTTPELLMSVENDHPFRCSVCGSDYRGARYAASCCEAYSVDLRDGTTVAFTQEAEDAFQAADEAKWGVISEAYHYECSCGERFQEIHQAITCRKCRVYAPEGICTQVVDTETDRVVWVCLGGE